MQSIYPSLWIHLRLSSLCTSNWYNETYGGHSMHPLYLEKKAKLIIILGRLYYNHTLQKNFIIQDLQKVNGAACVKFIKRWHWFHRNEAREFSILRRSKGWSLLRIRTDLSKVRHLIPKRRNGYSVVSGYFDPYLNNVIAPDHFLGGIGKRFVEACYLQLCDGLHLKPVDTMICTSSKDMKMGTHGTLFHAKKVSDKHVHL